MTNHIAALFNLSGENANIFLSQFSRMELKKNAVFIPEGQVCNKVGLIEQGLMKCVYNKEGRRWSLSLRMSITLFPTTIAL